MKERILSADESEEYLWQEGCFILELLSTPKDPGLSIARARVEPGRVTKLHRLSGIVERYVILEGSGRVEVGDLAPQDVKPGDVVIIPPECNQRIANTGVVDLVFLAICTPRFARDAYQDVQDE
jgi:mannose-6-phosphate isomerase-like protein (cupin superfamily)